MIDTGDIVRHLPSGEEWLVAYVRGDRLCACGWPESLALLSDCTLIEKASPKKRLELLRSMSSSNCTRGSYARHALAEMAEPPVRWAHDDMGTATGGE